MPDLEARLHSARYYVHKMRAAEYARYVLAGSMSVERAREEYDKAMQNFDAVMDAADSRSSFDANAENMAIGSSEIDAMLERARA